VYYNVFVHMYIMRTCVCKRLIYDGIDKSSMYKTVIVRSLK